MAVNEFGIYLRKLRSTRQPPVTQETLALAVGRNKMTISQFEQGKNAPPRGELLDKIIRALKLSEDEEKQLRFLAAEQRKTVPGDIEEYFFRNPIICKAIRAAQKNNAGAAEWEKIIGMFGGEI